MTREELKNYIIDNGYPNGRQLSKHPYFVSELRKETKFLDSVYDEVKDVVRCFVILYGIHEVPKCLYCGEAAKIGSHREKVEHYFKNGFTSFCSRSCSVKGTQELRKENQMNKYGVKHHMQREDIKTKVQDTTEERYGVRCYIASKEFQEEYSKKYQEQTGYKHHFTNPEVKKKIADSNIEKYGFPNPFQFSKEKIKETNLELYGFEYATQSPEVRKRTEGTNFERYGGKAPLCNPEIVEKVKATNTERYGHSTPTRAHYPEDTWLILNDRDKLSELYKSTKDSRELAKLLGIGSHRTVLLALHEHGIEVRDIKAEKVSKFELELHNFLEEYSIKYISSDRTLLYPKELDIYIPEYNVAIEFNGVYWHSDVYKDKFYHQNKSLVCMEKGIQLIHIYEDQWIDEQKREILKEKILSKCGISRKERIYARKCKIITPTKNSMNLFYNSTHIQGSNLGSISYGLEYKGELVAAISLKEYENDSFDLVRYSTDKNVIGGFGKLLSYFIKQKTPKHIFTFASLDYSHGNVYERLGFDNVGITGPNYHYFKGISRFSRQQFMKHKLSGKLEKYDPELTEKQNMINHGYTIMYDSGSIKFEMYL